MADSKRLEGGRGDGGGRKEGRGGDAIAAVPRYVGSQFNDAPPGHRYLMYLPFWRGEDWSKIKEGKQPKLKELGNIQGHTRKVMEALAARQRAVGESADAEIINAVSTSPFATGLGWEHPNENGFAFLHPYGLPYLAASGVKGVVRDAASELADGRDGDTHGWTQEAVTKLFGPMPEEIKKSEDASRGALRFFDVIPAIAGKGLDVDIMNPHYGDYYQAKKTDDHGREIYPDGATPHDAGSPVPIFFLVVPPESKFTFVVDCPREHLLPDELRSKWSALIRTAFVFAFDWLGFGAKTAVGYGALKIDEAAQQEAAKRRRQREEELERQRREAEREAALASMDPVDRAIREFLDARPDKNQPEWSALIGATKQGRFDEIGKTEVAKRIRELMQAQKRWREKSEAKKPEKDRNYQDTLLVKSWIEGK